MNSVMIRHLVLKDLYFSRGVIAFYLVAGIVSLPIVGPGGGAMFYVGSILLIVTLLSLGMHLVIASIIHERKEHTLPFVIPHFPDALPRFGMQFAPNP